MSNAAEFVLSQLSVNDWKNIEGHSRAICWMLWLDCLSFDNPTSWTLLLSNERSNYASLKNNLLIDPSKAEDVDATLNNPLSLDTHTPWSQYFADRELKKEIIKDVERTFPEIEFFRSQKVQESMTNVLMVYSKLHKDMSYRQGMHEILAPIVYVLMEGFGCENECLLHESFIEADAFYLLDRVMKKLKVFYQPASVEDSQLQHAINHIFTVMLRSADADLYRHLMRLQIEPKLFLIRWLRLVFSREFQFQNVLRLWDGLFSSGISINLISCVCIVMIEYYRDELMKSNATECLQILMHYEFPCKQSMQDDVAILVDRAIELSQNLSFEIIYSFNLVDKEQRDVLVSKRPESGSNRPNSSASIQKRASSSCLKDNISAVTNTNIDRNNRIILNILQSVQHHLRSSASEQIKDAVSHCIDVLGGCKDAEEKFIIPKLAMKNEGTFVIVENTSNANEKKRETSSKAGDIRLNKI